MENLIQKIERQKRDKEIQKKYPALTLAELAKRYKLSRERIRQIIVKVKT